MKRTWGGSLCSQPLYLICSMNRGYIIKLTFSHTKKELLFKNCNILKLQIGHLLSMSCLVKALAGCRLPLAAPLPSPLRIADLIHETEGGRGCCGDSRRVQCRTTKAMMSSLVWMFYCRYSDSYVAGIWVWEGHTIHVNFPHLYEKCRPFHGSFAKRSMIIQAARTKLAVRKPGFGCWSCRALNS